MRRRPINRDDSATVDMTPMLDIVFIMLIFFIVSAVFLDERALALSETPDSTPPTGTVQRPILVQLDQDDQAYVEGESVALLSISSRIEAMRASQPQAPILLTVNEHSSVDAVVYLKDQFDRTGQSVTIKVQKSE